MAVGAALAVAVLPACGSDDDQAADRNAGSSASAGESSLRLQPKRYSAKVDHPLMPLSSVRFTRFQGNERGTKLGVTQRVLKKTSRVAGVPVAVVDVKEYENGELVEHTLDYYTQRRDGAVLYMGERVDDFKDGKLVGHSGEWLAGKDGAKPGLFMPARPKVGLKFEQERAPGVAEDRSSVVAVGRKVTTPAGSFSDCIKTRDVAPLDNKVEFKFYCRGVGLVREQAPRTELELVRYR
jgi:hypothetical protein